MKLGGDGMKSRVFLNALCGTTVLSFLSTNVTSAQKYSIKAQNNRNVLDVFSKENIKNRETKNINLAEESDAASFDAKNSSWEGSALCPEKSEGSNKFPISKDISKINNPHTKQQKNSSLNKIKESIKSFIERNPKIIFEAPVLFSSLVGSALLYKVYKKGNKVTEHDGTSQRRCNSDQVSSNDEEKGKRESDTDPKENEREVEEEKGERESDTDPKENEREIAKEKDECKNDTDPKENEREIAKEKDECKNDTDPKENEREVAKEKGERESDTDPKENEREIAKEKGERESSTDSKETEQEIEEEKGKREEDTGSKETEREGEKEEDERESGTDSNENEQEIEEEGGKCVEDTEIEDFTIKYWHIILLCVATGIMQIVDNNDLGFGVDEKKDDKKGGALLGVGSNKGPALEEKFKKIAFSESLAGKSRQFGNWSGESFTIYPSDEDDLNKYYPLLPWGCNNCFLLSALHCAFAPENIELYKKISQMTQKEFITFIDERFKDEKLQKQKPILGEELYKWEKLKKDKKKLEDFVNKSIEAMKVFSNLKDFKADADTEDKFLWEFTHKALVAVNKGKEECIEEGPFGKSRRGTMANPNDVLKRLGVLGGGAACFGALESSFPAFMELIDKDANYFEIVMASEEFTLQRYSSYRDGKGLIHVLRLRNTSNEGEKTFDNFYEYEKEKEKKKNEGSSKMPVELTCESHCAIGDFGVGPLPFDKGFSLKREIGLSDDDIKEVFGCENLEELEKAGFTTNFSEENGRSYQVEERINFSPGFKDKKMYISAVSIPTSYMGCHYVCYQPKYVMDENGGFKIAYWVYFECGGLGKGIKIYSYEEGMKKIINSIDSRVSPAQGVVRCVTKETILKNKEFYCTNFDAFYNRMSEQSKLNEESKKKEKIEELRETGKRKTEELSVNKNGGKWKKRKNKKRRGRIEQEKLSENRKMGGKKFNDQGHEANAEGLSSENKSSLCERIFSAFGAIFTNCCDYVLDE